MDLCRRRGVRDKAHRKGIDAVTGIFGGKTLPFEDVAEMTSAVGAHDLHSFHTERMVGVADDSAGYFIVEGRPATTAVEFVGGAVERRIAAPANVGACRFVIPIFAGKGMLSALLGDDVLFFGCQGIPIWAVIFHAFFFYNKTQNRQKVVRLNLLHVSASRAGTGKTGVQPTANPMQGRTAQYLSILILVRWHLFAVRASTC